MTTPFDLCHGYIKTILPKSAIGKQSVSDKVGAFGRANRSVSGASDDVSRQERHLKAGQRLLELLTVGTRRRLVKLAEDKVHGGNMKHALHQP